MGVYIIPIGNKSEGNAIGQLSKMVGNVGIIATPDIVASMARYIKKRDNHSAGFVLIIPQALLPQAFPYSNKTVTDIITIISVWRWLNAHILIVVRNLDCVKDKIMQLYVSGIIPLDMMKVTDLFNIKA